MNFIKLTLTNDQPVFINLELVRDVFETSNKTTLSFDNEYCLSVKESPNEIFGLANVKIMPNDKL